MSMKRFYAVVSGHRPLFADQLGAVSDILPLPNPFATLPDALYQFIIISGPRWLVILGFIRVYRRESVATKISFQLWPFSLLRSAAVRCRTDSPLQHSRRFRKSALQNLCLPR